MLTDTAIKAAKPGGKPVKLSDEKGLFLYVTPAGGKLWRLKYRFGGREKLLAFGAYPEITLKEARDYCDEARRLLAQGADPGAVKQAQKAAAKAGAGAESFETTAREWFARYEARWSPSHRDKQRRIMERDLIPPLGHRRMREIEALDVLQALRLIEKRGAIEVAHDAMQAAGRIFRLGVAEGRCARDVTADLRGALTPVPKAKHMAAIIEPVAFGGLLRAIDGFTGTFHMQCALKLLPLVFTRVQELRMMEWAEVDLGAATWNIGADKMKMRQPHMVPLARQAVEILRELRMLTGRGRYAFPNMRDPKRPMSNMAINAALRRMGIDTRTEHTGHGFRAAARTLLHEQLRFEPAIIEHQLAHAVPDALGQAYNRTRFIEDRTKMMQAWADYLDKLKQGADVIPLRA